MSISQIDYNVEAAENETSVDQQSSYRQIMKATSIFGGVQVFQIIIQIIRSKFIAILLGPIGMGIAGLLNTTVNLINVLTNFGIGTSAVKDISSAESTGNRTRIAVVVTVVQRIVWITGMIGLIITLVLSSWLSKLTFGNCDYTAAFIWISVTLLFTQLTSGKLVLLQGLRKIQYLAKANLYGSLLGLIITVPLYYLFGLNGIVPGIIVSSVIAFTVPSFFVRKLNIDRVLVSRNRTIAEAKSMLVMGFSISLSVLFAVGASYIIRIYIGHKGGVADVGLYSAGFSILTTYVGLIFNAMGTDFYPRLSSVANDKHLTYQTISQQAEVAVLILAPILTMFIVFINLVIIILYSSKFLAINNMILWAALGMFFKVITWLMGFLYIVKGSIKIYFWNELLSNIYSLGLNLLGYYYFGLTGLGVSFLLAYFLSMIQCLIISRVKFSFSFNKTFIKIFSFLFTLAVLCLIIVQEIQSPFHYFTGLVVITICALFSWKKLDERIAISNLIKSKIGSFRS